FACGRTTRDPGGNRVRYPSRAQGAPETGRSCQHDAQHSGKDKQPGPGNNLAVGYDGPGGACSAPVGRRNLLAVSPGTSGDPLMNSSAGPDAVVAALPELAPLDDHNRRLLAEVHPPDWINPTPDPRYNLVVLGAGTAGLVTAAGAAGLGAKVALVEKR